MGLLKKVLQRLRVEDEFATRKLGLIGNEDGYTTTWSEEVVSVIDELDTNVTVNLQQSGPNDTSNRQKYIVDWMYYSTNSTSNFNIRMNGDGSSSYFWDDEAGNRTGPVSQIPVIETDNFFTYSDGEMVFTGHTRKPTVTITSRVDETDGNKRARYGYLDVNEPLDSVTFNTDSVGQLQLTVRRRTY